MRSGVMHLLVDGHKRSIFLGSRAVLFFSHSAKNFCFAAPESS